MGYSYDQLNRLQTVVDNGALAGQNQTTYSYDAVGNLSSATLPNGAAVTPTFDQMGKPGDGRDVTMPISPAQRKTPVVREKRRPWADDRPCPVSSGGAA